MHNKALKEAFFQSKRGKEIAIKAKKYARSRRIAKAIREANQLFYSAWVKAGPDTGKKWRVKVFHNLKPRLKTLAIKAALKKKGDDEEYNKVMTALKFLDFQDAFSRIEKFEPYMTTK